MWFIGKEFRSPSVCRPGERNYRMSITRVDLQSFKMKKDLMRMVQRAQRGLTLERSSAMTREHDELIREFIKRERPNALDSSPLFKSACLCEAVRKRHGIECVGSETKSFCVLSPGSRSRSLVTYIAGCHSKKHYVDRASSDLLFFEMLEVARERGRGMVNLGFGGQRGNPAVQGEVGRRSLPEVRVLRIRHWLYKNNVPDQGPGS